MSWSFIILVAIFGFLFYGPHNKPAEKKDDKKGDKKGGGKKESK